MLLIQKNHPKKGWFFNKLFICSKKNYFFFLSSIDFPIVSYIIGEATNSEE